MITIEDLIRALRMLPDDAGVINWELTSEGVGTYTLTVSVIFTVAHGEPPPWPHLAIREG